MREPRCLPDGKKGFEREGGPQKGKGKGKGPEIEKIKRLNSGKNKRKSKEAHFRRREKR